LTSLAKDFSVAAALTAVAAGAVFGAWLRYGLALWLNPRSTAFPLGTLAANLIGGYLVGIAIAMVAAHPSMPPFWRLLIITGFLGSLTTFSTFSAESVVMLGSAQWVNALTHAGLHLAGSLAATAIGIATYRLFS
jgi:fluoride exporter